MEKIKNLHSVSSLWFFVFAFAYVAMALAFRNGYMADFTLSLMRVLDLPFAFVSLLYGGSTLVLQLNINQEGALKSPGWALAISTLCILLFALVVFVNVAFPPII